MSNLALTEEDKKHWAYLSGAAEGRADNGRIRGLIAYSLKHAESEVDRRVVRLWLAGFDGAIPARREQMSPQGRGQRPVFCGPVTGRISSAVPHRSSCPRP